MHCRTPDQFWSQFGRPFIFVPTSFLNDHDSKLGYHPNQGEDEKLRKSENPPSPTTLGSSATPYFTSSLTYPSDLRKDDSLAPIAEKTTSRGRLRKARLADTKRVQRAEDVPEYKGQMSVEDLVKFINSGTLKKDSVKTKTKKHVMKNNSEKHQNGSFDNRLKHEVRGRKLSEETELEEHGSKTEKTDSTIHKGVNPEEDPSDMDRDSDDITGHDFITVSRKKKGKPHPTKENSLNAMHLTSEVHQSHPEMERIRKPKGIYKQSKALMCENRSFVPKTQDSSDQTVTSSHRREVTVTFEGGEQNPSTNSSVQKGGTSTEHPSQDLQIKNKRTTHQTESQTHPTGVSVKSKVHSLSTKVTSCGYLKSKSPAAKSRNIRPPVVFTDKHYKESENIVGISFGFDAQEAESGPKSTNYTGITPAEPSVSTDFDHLDEELHNTKSQAVLLTSNCSNENNCYEVMRNTTLQSGTYIDSEVKKVVSCVRLLKDAKACQNNSITRNAKAEKHRTDSAKELNISATGTVQNTGCVKDNLSSTTKPPEPISSNNSISSDKVEVHPVNCTASSKSLTVSAATKSAMNSVSVTNLGVISVDLSPCATPLSSTGRPISVVAPNQLLKTICSSSHSLCSSSGSSSGHSESSGSNCASLGHTESSSVGQSFCSSVGQSSPSGSCHGSSTILGPCARAPVVKVAPMLVEKLVFNQVTDAKCFREEAVPTKSETALGDDQRTTCNSLPQEEIKEQRLVTEDCDVKHELCPHEHEYEVPIKQEPFSHKHNCDVIKQERSLHKPDCNVVKQDPGLKRNQCLLETKSDRTATEVHQETNCHPQGSSFDLLSAQIYLYKSYLDCLSDQHEVYKDVASTDQGPLQTQLAP